MALFEDMVKSCYSKENISRKYLQKPPHSSPVRVSYGVCFVRSRYDIYFTSSLQYNIML